MDKAVEFAREILRKEKALGVTQSKKLKHDYSTSLRRDRGDLIYYCQCKGISVRDAYTKARG